MPFPCFIQEEEEKALGIVAEEEEPRKEVEEDEGEGSDTSSEKFGFGFSGAKVAKPQPKEKKRKAGDDTEKLEKVKKEKADKSQASLESASKTKAASFKKLFDELQLVQIWKGTIKMKDVDSKVDKALQVGQQLQASPDQAVQSQANELISQVEAISGKIDTIVMLSKIHYAVAAEGMQDDALELSRMEMDRANSLPQDCTHAIMTDFGEALAKVRQTCPNSNS